MNIYQNPKFASYWNERAGEEGEVYKRDILDPIMFGLLGDLGNKTILELGCGNGYLGKRFLKQRPHRVILTDISERNIKFAKRKTNRENIDCIIMDATKKWPIDTESLDIVYSNMMLKEIENIKTPISEAYRTLKNAGQFVFSVTHPSWDLYIYAQEKAGRKSKKIKGLGGYFTRNYSKYIMGSNSKTNPDLYKTYGKEFEVEHFHRPLEDYFNSLVEFGFQVKKLFEPEMSSEFLKENPRFSEYKDHPVSLIFYSIKI